MLPDDCCSCAPCRGGVPWAMILPQRAPSQTVVQQGRAATPSAVFRGFPATGSRETLERIPQRAAQWFELPLEVPRVPDCGAVDRLSDLLGARRAHRPARLVESQAGRLEGQATVRQQLADSRFRILDQVLVLKAQHTAR